MTNRRLVYDLVKVLVVAPLATCLLAAGVAATFSVLAGTSGARSDPVGLGVVGFLVGVFLFAPTGTLVLGGGVLAVRLGAPPRSVQATVTGVAVLVGGLTVALLLSGGGGGAARLAFALVATVGVGFVVWLLAGWMLRPHGTTALVPPPPSFLPPPPPPAWPAPPPPPREVESGPWEFGPWRSPS